MQTVPELDHLVYAVPDLADGVRTFAAATGVEPARGGRHLGFGTANYLVGLGPGRYLEIIGPDPDAADEPVRRLFDVDATSPAGLRTWAVATTDIAARVRAARAGGYNPGDPMPMSRRTDGGELRWQLTPDTVDESAGLVPFLIDWGKSAHPTTRDLPQLQLRTFTLGHPHLDVIVARLRALGIELDVHPAPTPGLRAVLTTPRGEFVVTSAGG